MYCTVCGRETSRLINYCSSCGYRLNSPREMRSATVPPVYSEAHDQAEPLKGIGGWLMFFCIVVTVAAPLVLFIDWHADLMAFVRTMFGLVTGVMVWSVRPSALSWLRGYFAIAIVTRIGALILFSTSSYASSSLWFEQFTGHLIALFVTMAWIAYFLFSARVKATLGSNL
jgi:hypothetical protein